MEYKESRCYSNVPMTLRVAEYDCPLSSSLHEYVPSFFTLTFRNTSTSLIGPELTNGIPSLYHVIREGGEVGGSRQ